MYIVYILLCSDNSYYTGLTNDFEKRIWQHETCAALSLMKSAQLKSMYTVYILLCSDNTYYTGLTNDFEKRIWQHETCAALSLTKGVN